MSNGSEREDKKANKTKCNETMRIKRRDTVQTPVDPRQINGESINISQAATHMMNRIRECAKEMNSWGQNLTDSIIHVRHAFNVSREMASADMSKNDEGGPAGPWLTEERREEEPLLLLELVDEVAGVENTVREEDEDGLRGLVGYSTFGSSPPY